MMCSGFAARIARTWEDIEVSEMETSAFLTSLAPEASMIFWTSLQASCISGLVRQTRP